MMNRDDTGQDAKAVAAGRAGDAEIRDDAGRIDAAHGGKSSDAAEPNTPASVGASNFASRVAREQLATGATVLALENRATPTVSLRGSLRAGSYFEPRDQPGLARLCAEMLTRGTRRRTKLDSRAISKGSARSWIFRLTLSPWASGVAASRKI